MLTVAIQFTGAVLLATAGCSSHTGSSRVVWRTPATLRLVGRLAGGGDGRFASHGEDDLLCGLDGETGMA